MEPGSFRVQLSSLVMDPRSKMLLGATREVLLPAAPFIGLELYLTEVVRFVVEEVLFDVTTGEWHVKDADVVLGEPSPEAVAIGATETIEDHAAWMEEAGFKVEVTAFDGKPQRFRWRH